MTPLFALIFASLLATPTFSPEVVRRDEVRLLHQIVRAIDLSSNLRLFDTRSGDWLRTASSDPPSARVLILYLWTTAAPTATQELPWLREMARRIEAHHTGDARFLFISEGTSAAEMKSFLAGFADRAPNLPFFLDGEGAITEGLRQVLPGAELPMPITLLLDDQRIVRQAFVGSLATRRSELVSAVSDLLYEIRATRGRHL